jgi:hypothetical protein
MLLLVHLSSSEIMSCKECGQRFATAGALRKHKNLGKEERERQGETLSHKRLDKQKRRGKAQNLNRQPG